MNNMKKSAAIFGLLLVMIMPCSDIYGKSPKFKALILTERGGDHEGFVVAALSWLKEYAAEENPECIFPYGS
jgi:uncharacterized protein